TRAPAARLLDRLAPRKQTAPADRECASTAQRRPGTPSRCPKGGSSPSTADPPGQVLVRLGGAQVGLVLLAQLGRVVSARLAGEAGPVPPVLAGDGQAVSDGCLSPGVEECAAGAAGAGDEPGDHRAHLRFPPGQPDQNAVIVGAELHPGRAAGAFQQPQAPVLPCPGAGRAVEDVPGAPMASRSVSYGALTGHRPGRSCCG